MKLSDHPQVTFRGCRTWPPTWVQLPERNGQAPGGELGILEKVKPSIAGHRVYLMSRYDGQIHLGHVDFDDDEFCKKIYKLMKRNCGRAIKEIAELEVP